MVHQFGTKFCTVLFGNTEGMGEGGVRGGIRHHHISSPKTLFFFFSFLGGVVLNWGSVGGQIGIPNVLLSAKEEGRKEEVLRPNHQEWYAKKKWKLSRST